MKIILTTVFLNAFALFGEVNCSLHFLSIFLALSLAVIVSKLFSDPRRPLFSSRSFMLLILKCNSFLEGLVRLRIEQNNR